MTDILQGVKEGNDDLPVNFDAYLEAMEAYENQKHEDFIHEFRESETLDVVKFVMRIHPTLGYTTVEDKLETVLAVGWYDLPKGVNGLRMKVERL